MLNPELLQRHPIFNLVDHGQLAALTESAQLRRLTTGELLYREHETAQSLFVVKSGHVRVLRKSDEDREITVGTCRDGDLIGDYSLLEPHRSAATCRVSTDAKIWSLPLASVLRLLRSTFGKASLRPWLKLQFLVRFLRNESYLGFMSGGSFLPMLDDCQELSFEAGETIQAEGLFSDSLFVVTKGSVQRAETWSEQVSSAGRSIELFGVETLLNRANIPCITAETTVACWRICHKNLMTTREVNEDGQSLALPQRTLSLHFPFVRQQSVTECGCASLAMVARFHRVPVTIESVRETVSLNYRGASLGDLQSAAEQLGFRGRAIRIADAHLTGVTLPAIAHLPGDHYVVVYDANEDVVIVGDPAVGVIQHSRSQFRQIWNGTLLLLQPPSIA
ncbi:MAG: cysteine peptidase family C39 domain-containing protein [Planctomycetaceae bacterium]